MEFYRDLTEKSGFELETAGSLKGGRKIWALAKTGQSGLLAGNDRTDAYVLLATACDGTLATTAQFTSVRVVCNNTLAVALNGQSQCVKVSHRSVFDAEAVKKKLGVSVSAWDDFMYRLRALSERKVTPRETETYIRCLLQPHPDQVIQRVNERAMGKVLALFDGDGRGACLPSSHGTAYGLLNAVTEFVDHQRRARSTDHRLDSAWFGQGAILKQKAFDQALAMVA
jgi:phage/plasmid-like protein (TIGR03299 family)